MKSKTIAGHSRFKWLALAVVTMTLVSSLIPHPSAFAQDPEPTKTPTATAAPGEEPTKTPTPTATAIAATPLPTSTPESPAQTQPEQPAIQPTPTPTMPAAVLPVTGGTQADTWSAALMIGLCLALTATGFALSRCRRTTTGNQEEAR